MAVLPVLLVISIVGALAHIPHGSIGEKQDPMFTEALLREVVERMGRDFNDVPYMEYQPMDDRQLAMMVRVNKDLENEEYDSISDGNPSPSLRDQEFLQHSTLWGHQYVAGGAGEGEQRLQPSGAITNRQLVKSDAVLPAYCNPPNPCPFGYSEEQNCLIEFENTAEFSREYQQRQRCMCDGEHMFSCPPDADMDLPFTDHKNLVSKKFNVNPFLTGERLPIAAKKGFEVNVF